MSIIRTYACEACGHVLEVELRADQWAAEPPECPRCAANTHQEFTPPAIGGSHLARAARLAEDIAEKDYGVADMKFEKHATTPRVRYRDTNPQAAPSWGAMNATLTQAMTLGREARLKHGSGLEVLQTSIKNGTMPDMIANAKKTSARIW